MPQALDSFFLLFLLIATAAASCAGTWLVLRVMTRLDIRDHPNERSSHAAPTPHGGGLAVVPVLLAGWIVVALLSGHGSLVFWIVVCGAALLACLSWLDDLKGVPELPRLACQAVVVAAALWTLPSDALVFQGWLPVWLDRVIAALAWIWFINLYNFMDGIDGISGVETISIGVGLGVVGFSLTGYLSPLPLIVAAAAAGFLVWNWSPARIFLGDTGAVPLGYLLGWLLLWLAAEGQWAAALLLPLYYLADATLTLGRRALRVPKPWRPHREHFYQRATQRGLSHRAVSLRILLCNTGLVALALTAVLGYPWPALGAGLLLVAGLLRHFAGPGGASART